MFYVTAQEKKEFGLQFMFLKRNSTLSRERLVQNAIVYTSIDWHSHNGVWTLRADALFAYVYTLAFVRMLSFALAVRSWGVSLRSSFPDALSSTGNPRMLLVYTDLCNCT